MPSGFGPFLATSPNGDMNVCDDSSDSPCEEDFATFCPVGWDLCTEGQFNARNDGWADGFGPELLGEIHCRGDGDGGGAGHYTIDSNPLSDDVAMNCWYGSSRADTWLVWVWLQRA